MARTDYTILSVSQSTYPVDLTLAKSHLHVEHDLDDAYITMLIAAATKVCQQYCWRYFAPVSLIVQINEDFSGPFRLPYPVVNVTSMFQNNGDGSDADLDGYYDIRTAHDVSFVCPRDSWSNIDKSDFANITITYDTGMATTAVDEDIKVAILLTLADMYENRLDRVRQLPMASRQILEPHRLWQFR